MTQALDLAAMVAHIKATVRLEDEARSFGVELEGRGRRLEGHCPLPGHEDDTPSFDVYTTTQRYYCFGCQRGGDVIDFVRLMGNCSFLEACERLMGKAPDAASTGWGGAMGRPHPPAQTGGRARAAQRAPEHVAILTRAMAHYHQAVLRSAFVLQYLSSRGTSLRGVKRCLLGYADGSFRKSLVGRPHLWQAALDVGLLTSSGREWLSGRLIIPEIVGGACTWLIGRVLPAPVPQRVLLPDKKYLGLPIDKPLLGYGRALALLEGEGRPPLLGIHIVEGAIDYVITQEWSLPFYNLSLLGTHASREHLQNLLSLHTRSGGLPFIVNLDGDERGGLALLRLLEQLRGFPVLTLPQVSLGKDLGQLAETVHGYAGFRRAFAAAGEGEEWL